MLSFIENKIFLLWVFSELIKKLLFGRVDLEVTHEIVSVVENLKYGSSNSKKRVRLLIQRHRELLGLSVQSTREVTLTVLFQS